MGARTLQVGEIATTLFDPEAEAVARQMWQHGGDIVSSRRANATLEGRSDSPQATQAKVMLKGRVGALAGAPSSHVRLHPTGMSALHAALRLAMRLHPGRPTAQLGFPYVDTLKLQERMGKGAVFFPHGRAADLDALQAHLTAGELAAVFTEVPTNPLMQTLDLPRLAQMTRKAGVPLVVDDSAATFFNLDLSPHADVLVSSLTKHFSGSGEAMGGALVVVAASPLAARLQAGLDDEDLLWGEDAEVLLAGAETFEARMPRINATAAHLAAALTRHPAVARVHHPALDTDGAYAGLMRPAGGHGGMLSLLLRDANRAPAFYDALDAAKGPSFGLPCTIACPYTLLAHYAELAWAESCGVARHLVRVSVGLEAPDTLVPRFEHALERAAGKD